MIRHAVVLLSIALSACGGDGGGDPDATANPLECEDWPTGCRCVAGGPDELQECTATSVVDDPNADGYCCALGSSFCDCMEIECWQTGVGCTCGVGDIIGGLGTQVPSCSGTHCCLDDNPSFRWCTCADGACDTDETEVASCTLDRVKICREDETLTDSCRP